MRQRLAWATTQPTFGLVFWSNVLQNQLPAEGQFEAPDEVLQSAVGTANGFGIVNVANAAGSGELFIVSFEHEE